MREGGQGGVGTGPGARAGRGQDGVPQCQVAPRTQPPAAHAPHPAHRQVALHARHQLGAALVAQAQHLPHQAAHELHALRPAGQAAGVGAAGVRASSTQGATRRCQMQHAPAPGAHLSWSTPSSWMMSTGDSTAPSATSQTCTRAGRGQWRGGRCTRAELSKHPLHVTSSAGRPARLEKANRTQPGLASAKAKERPYRSAVGSNLPLRASMEPHSQVPHSAARLRAGAGEAHQGSQMRCQCKLLQAGAPPLGVLGRAGAPPLQGMLAGVVRPPTCPCPAAARWAAPWRGRTAAGACPPARPPPAGCRGSGPGTSCAPLGSRRGGAAPGRGRRAGVALGARWLPQSRASGP